MEQYAIYALVAIFIIDKVLDHLKRKGIDLDKMADSLKRLDEIDFDSWKKGDRELHNWHNHEDPDQPGVKIWWNQKYIAEAIREIARLSNIQSEILKEMREEMRESKKAHSEIIRKINGK